MDSPAELPDEDLPGCAPARPWYLFPGQREGKDLRDQLDAIEAQRAALPRPLQGLDVQRDRLLNLDAQELRDRLAKLAGQQ